MVDNESAGNQMISIVCCYNKLHEFNKMLESLKNQDVAYEIIAVNNVENEFRSAADALNWGAKRANGDILVFLHQDIIFLKTDSLRRFTDTLSICKNKCCVVGLFGAARQKKGFATEYEIQDTLDECCVAMSRATWEKYPFNNQLCNGWHLYVVEQCIRIREAGGQVISGHFDIQHISTGNVDEKYMETFKQLLIRYKNEQKICTTCKSMPTNLIYFQLYHFLWKLKKRLLGNYNLVYNMKKLIMKIEDSL